jgi:hypothetical protein
MPAEGTIIRSPDGTQRKILKGGQWVDYAGPVPGQSSGSKRGLTGSNANLSPDDQKFLNRLADEASGANETARIYDRATGLVKSLKTGPWRNSLLLSPAVPEDKGGILDTIGSVVVGGPARATGALTPKEISAYQELKALTNQQVLEKQIQQKGTQTEGDAARMMLTDISPGKNVDVNLNIIGNGRFKAQRVQAKSQFYNQWAQKYGLHGSNEQGLSADAYWAKFGDKYTRQIFPIQQAKPKGNSGVKVISIKELP